MIDVCVCTYQRPASLQRTLQSLAKQRWSEGMRVIVADNDFTPSAKAVVDASRPASPHEIVYLHAPAQNISIARNACLAASSETLLAFIDDDEEASPDWLSTLYDHLLSHRLDVVFGPVQAIYQPGTLAWIAEGDFLSTRPWIPRSGRIDTGYAGNVLLRRAVCGATRFNPDFGRTGGEDTLFFAALHSGGARLGYCATAEVTHHVPAKDTTLRSLMRRRFRAGQGSWRALRDRGEGPLQILAMAIARVAYCCLQGLLALPSPVGWRRYAISTAFHAGVVARSLGIRADAIYG
ncbi:MAG: glycosyltransferase family 2 protein [Hyphomonadaceae bacterium]|nr:glycosyltransferase family 2 protein [Hyphomonadaceae bacterium]